MTLEYELVDANGVCQSAVATWYVRNAQ